MASGFKSIQSRKALFEKKSTNATRGTETLEAFKRKRGLERVKADGGFPETHRRERSRSLGSLLDDCGPGWLPLRMDGYGPADDVKEERKRETHRRYSALYPTKASQKIVMQKVYVSGAGAARITVTADDELSDLESDSGEAAIDIEPMSPLGATVHVAAIEDVDTDTSAVVAMKPTLSAPRSAPAFEEDDEDTKKEEEHSASPKKESASGGSPKKKSAAKLSQLSKGSRKVKKKRKKKAGAKEDALINPGLLSASSGGAKKCKKTTRRKTLTIDTRRSASKAADSSRLRQRRSPRKSAVTPTVKPVSRLKRRSLATPTAAGSLVTTPKKGSRSTPRMRIRAGTRYRLENGDIGICKFYGKTHKFGGKMVGLSMEVGTGNCNGSLEGKSYFRCRKGKGRFVDPSYVIEDLGSGFRALTGTMKRESRAMKSDFVE